MGERPPRCTLCGRVADPAVDGDPPLSWTVELDDPHGTPARVCPECTRRHVRAIEAKLEQEWW